jgi:hypothetical protein
VSGLFHVRAVSADGWETWHSVHGAAGRAAAFASAARPGCEAAGVPAPDLSWLPAQALSLHGHALAFGWDASVTRIPQGTGDPIVRVTATHLEERIVFIAFWRDGRLESACGTGAGTLREGRAQIGSMRRRQAETVAAAILGSAQ